MAKIRYIKDNQEEIVFPVTHERGVLDSNGANLETKLLGKQATLISGTNIKTLNGISLLGSGNLALNGSNIIYTGEDGDATIIYGDTVDQCLKGLDDQAAYVISNYQYKINDLDAIRAGAAAGATAYQKPSTGIPKSALASAVKTSLEKADTALQPSALNGYATEGYVDEEVYDAVSGKQDTLVSGTNIKTINGETLLGSGNIEVAESIDTVEVSVDSNTGTPSATASVSGSTLTMAFHNLKGETGATGPQGIQGPQGNTGSSVDYPYELVNNLTTDDAEKGLTAAMGAKLDNVNKTNVPIPSGGKVIYHYINSSLNWTTNGYHRSLIIDVVAGERYLVTAKDDHDAVYTFLTSRAQTHSTGAAAPVVDGTTNVTIPMGTTVEIEIPETCICLCFRGCTSQAQYNQSSTLLCPSTLVRFEHLNDVVDRLQENKLLPYISAYGNGMTYGGSDWLLDVIPKRSYRLHTLTPDVAMSSITGGSATATLIIRFDVGDSVALASAAVAFRDYYTVTVPEGASKMRFDVRCDIGEYFAMSVELLAEGNGTSILALNPDSEFRPKVFAARKRYYTSTDTSEAHPLTFLHLSDIHGNWTNVARYLEFAKYYDSYFDGLINTGDTVVDKLSDGVSGYAALTGVENVMVVIGNHDTRGNRGGADWQDNINLPAYNALIAPFVSNWGVTQPTDAATFGYCYYYKDYTAKNVRLIVVDIMAYDDTEDTWLRATLSAARTAGLHVLIATHYAGARRSSEASEQRVFDKIACNYTTLYPFGSASVNLTNYNTSAYKMTVAVKDFLDEGGHFAGYIQGHYHADFIAKVNEDSRQLIYSIGSSKAGEVRDYNHIVGTRNQDEFQIVAVDTKNTIVKLFKVGAHIDRYARTKGSVCVDYTTGDLLGEGYF